MNNECLEMIINQLKIRLRLTNIIYSQYWWRSEKVKAASAAEKNLEEIDYEENGET